MGRPPRQRGRLLSWAEWRTCPEEHLTWMVYPTDYDADRLSAYAIDDLERAWSVEVAGIRKVTPVTGCSSSGPRTATRPGPDGHARWDVGHRVGTGPCV